ncbi:hypothetical protein H6F76_08115 [Leptolyngbya sp. FACHB-321]|uniref:hypothetical protein n=1 Tax=Leptolyngbya sp. FACHB-321 TaxID=2692807 RepID=UPI00168697CA|nr:hypothetical protein [Leptolyngbya sp. FACHB-321]MBD2034991.1 hypothetical protein [Leptolyngbya sp. FACHB-321]
MLIKETKRILLSTFLLQLPNLQRSRPSIPNVALLRGKELHAAFGQEWKDGSS